MPQLIASYKKQKPAQLFNPSEGWNTVAMNNKSNYYAGGGFRKELVEEVFKQDAISKRVSSDEGFTPSGSYLINEDALSKAFNVRTDNDGNFISTLRYYFWSWFAPYAIVYIALVVFIDQTQDLVISTFIIGSRRTAFAFGIASLNAALAAISNAITLESTS